MRGSAAVAMGCRRGVRGLDPDKIERLGRFRVIEPLGNARDLFLGEDEAGVRAVLKVLEAPERNQGLMDPRIAGEMST